MRSTILPWGKYCRASLTLSVSTRILEAVIEATVIEAALRLSKLFNEI